MNIKKFKELLENEFIETIESINKHVKFVGEGKLSWQELCVEQIENDIENIELEYDL